MFIALFIIVAIFAITTKGVFLSSRNISNLLNQTGYIAVLAVGMTLVIVIRHIDLSVGFLSGFIGALAAISMSAWHFPSLIAIPLALALGVFAGLITGFLVAQLNIPAFVATLAGFMIYRGAILLVTMGTGTIIISDDIYNAIGNGFIPDLPLGFFMPGLHKLTLFLGAAAVVMFIINEIKVRKVKMSYGFEVRTMDMFLLKILFI